MMEKGMSAISDNGIMGEPRRASAEERKIYLEGFADLVVSRIEPKTAD